MGLSSLWLEYFGTYLINLWLPLDYEYENDFKLGQFRKIQGVCLI